MLKRTVVNSSIEVEWNKVQNEGYYIGEDCWKSDEDGYLCGFILHVECALSIERLIERNSNMNNVTNLSIEISLDKFAGKILSICDSDHKCKLNVDKYFQISERQYIFKDSVIFDYRKMPKSFDIRYSALDFDAQTSTVYCLCSGIYLILDNNKNILFIVIKSLKSFQFSFGDEIIYLSDYNDVGNLLLDYTIDTWTDRLCDISQYEQLIRKSSKLLQYHVLQDFIIDKINVSIQFWKEQCEDEDNRDAEKVWAFYNR